MRLRFRLVMDDLPGAGLFRRLAICVSVLTLAAACGSDIDLGQQGALPATEEPAITAPQPSPTPAPVPTAPPTAPPTATPEPTPAPFRIGDGLARKLPPDWTPEVDATWPEPSDALPSGGVIGARGIQQNRWSYTGVLGVLKPNQRVIERAADQPAAVPGVAPLTGLPAEGLDRPALVVKIDNVPLARPQTGINQADIIYEELVEFGVTRLAAVFHSHAPTTIGPVRSGRSTDIGIIGSFNQPIFAFSGANSIYDRLIDKQEIENRGAEVFTGYRRGDTRPAPHNLYTGADVMLGSVQGGTAPDPHFVYRPTGEPADPMLPEAATIRLSYLEGKSAPIEFRWSSDVGGWQRWQAGSRHVDAAGVQLAPANVIVQFVDYVDTGMTDKFSEDLYEGVSVGTGPALIFTDGRVVEATWTRHRLRAATTYTDVNGDHVGFTPGQTFVALIAPGGASWSP
jgi:hypothetical protein